MVHVPAIAYLEQLDLSDASVFEYGSGNSTLFWASRARTLVSVEHDRCWYGEMAPGIEGAAVDYRFIDAPEAYAAAIDGKTFDVVVIDGEWRSECVAPARSALNPGGFLIFDNADWFPSDAGRLRDSGLIQIDFTGSARSTRTCSPRRFSSTPGSALSPWMSCRVAVAGLHENVQH